MHEREKKSETSSPVNKKIDLFTMFNGLKKTTVLNSSDFFVMHALRLKVKYMYEKQFTTIRVRTVARIACDT